MDDHTNSNYLSLELGLTLLHTTNYDFLFYYVLILIINYFSLFMSMSNLISINMNVIDMKRHMLICLSISMFVSMERG
jgi:hypothetical protein